MTSGNVGPATLTVRKTTRSEPCESAKSQLDTESGPRGGCEVDALLAAFERVMAQGAPEQASVAG